MRPTATLLSAVFLGSIFCGGASASTFATIFQFDSDTAENPHGTVIRDSDGVLYGTSYFFGPGGFGVVYKLSPPPQGKTKWRYEILHAFSGGKKDGAYPVGALVKDKGGALIGVTYQGGANDSGTAYRLTPPKHGETEWTETILYSFSTSESFPNGDLLRDEAGNLYGTINSGGSHSAGEVFRLRPPAEGEQNWSEDVLYEFVGTSDGHSPNAGLASDGDALYGTTSSGGASNLGTVFQLMPLDSGNGPWVQSVIHDFSGADGSGPRGRLIRKGAKLFGTTAAGGDMDYGTVFQLAPRGGQSWKETVIHSFSGADGRLPWSGMTMGPSGTLYGTTYEGGEFGKYGWGTVFSLTPPPAGQSEWTEQVLHSFNNGGDGNSPAAVWFDKSGAIYGVTQYGMHHNTGSIFQLIP